jgi:hypothetical protein
MKKERVPQLKSRAHTPATSTAKQALPGYLGWEGSLHGITKSVFFGVGEGLAAQAAEAELLGCWCRAMLWCLSVGAVVAQLAGANERQWALGGKSCRPRL